MLALSPRHSAYIHFTSISWAFRANCTIVHDAHTGEARDTPPLFGSWNFRSISKITNEAVKKTKCSIHLFTRHLKNIHYMQNTEIDIKGKHSWIYESTPQKAYNVVQEAGRCYGKKRKTGKGREKKRPREERKGIQVWIQTLTFPCWITLGKLLTSLRLSLLICETGTIIPTL